MKEKINLLSIRKKITATQKNAKAQLKDEETKKIKGGTNNVVWRSGQNQD